METTKRCSRCKQEKPLSEFKKDRTRKGGHYPQCRQCEQEYREANAETIRAHKKDYRENNAEKVKAHKHQYWVENADRLKAQKREYYLENSETIRAQHRDYNRRNREKVYQSHHRYYLENREKILAYLREWRSENRDRIQFLDRRYRVTHREEKREYERRYYDLNPHVEKAKKHKRRARAKAGGRFTSREFKELCARYDFRCLCCGGKKKLTPDHVIPLSKGGSNTIENIQPLCLGCNIRKGTNETDYR